ncbi:GDSL-type esterase/lipase family protein [Pseudenterobacter timonensis]|uniref:GDSL-type esterase/lipase family protein n=1 Tax=Pseudenterobacter timonensis TaxID=1755099 RepID=UPI00077B6FD4|nr:GDSL-type esterase/lipase family protein [Pseudenterobacter timonensis]
MSTTPTNLPVPSEKPQDLKFNAGKIDEFVTSLVNTYVDRFGNEHYTIEGLKQLVLQQIYNLGWNLKGTFQGGGTVTAAGDLLQDESTNIWYRWDDLETLPKTVPAGSSPKSAGGVGEGKWQPVDVSDVLRKQLNSNSGASLVRAEDGRTVQEWLVAVDSGEYKAKNIAGFSRIDYLVHSRGTFKVLFQGDSLTAGYDMVSTDANPIDGTDNAKHATTTFPQRFVDFINEQSGCNVTKTVRAISGYTAIQSLNNPDWQTNPNCDVAIIMLGVNDADGGSTLDVYMDSMEKLIRRLINWGMCVLFTLPSGGPRPGAAWFLWSKRMRNLATLYGCQVYDPQENVYARHRGAISSDTLHFNSMGYATHAHQLVSMFMGGGTSYYIR